MGTATTPDYRRPYRNRKLAATSVKIDREKLEAFKQVAASNHRSVSQELRWLIERHIAQANEAA